VKARALEDALSQKWIS